MGQELIAYLDERFRETAQQIQGLREETRQQFQDFREETTRRFEQVDEGIRHTWISIEAMRGDIRQVAEGVIGLDERLGFLRTELKQEIDQVRTFIPPLYLELDKRVRVLEVRKDLQGRDPVEIIRERYGRSSEVAAPEPSFSSRIDTPPTKPL